MIPPLAMKRGKSAKKRSGGLRCASNLGGKTVHWSAGEGAVLSRKPSGTVQVRGGGDWWTRLVPQNVLIHFPHELSSDVKNVDRECP